METKDFLIAIGHALVAVWGSCAKQAHEKNSTQQKIAAMFSDSVSASFVGVATYFFHMWTGLNLYASFLVAAVMGVLGAKGINVMTKIALKRTGMIDGIEKDVFATIDGKDTKGAAGNRPDADPADPDDPGGPGGEE